MICNLLKFLPLKVPEGNVARPFRIWPRRITQLLVSGDLITRTVTAETVGTLTRMGVTHEVATTGVGHDFPVTVLLDHLADVADGGAEVTHTVLFCRFTGAKTPSTGEMINDLTLLAEIVVVTHNDKIHFPKYTLQSKPGIPSV